MMHGTTNIKFSV